MTSYRICSRCVCNLTSVHGFTCV